MSINTLNEIAGATKQKLTVKFEPASLPININEVCGGMTKILPITTNAKEFPLHVSLPDGLPVFGKVELDHERSVDLSTRKYKELGRIPDDFLSKLIAMVKATY